MTKFHCASCKIPLPERKRYCEECRELKFEEQRQKHINRNQAKYRKTQEYGISLVKKYAEGRYWSSSHKNCFRATVTRNGQMKVAESMDHIRTKFERWLYHRKLGRTVYCELRLKEGMGRPDLVVISENDGSFVFCEEIVCSEKEVSIIKKKSKYPFPTNIIRTKNLTDF